MDGGCCFLLSVAILCPDSSLRGLSAIAERERPQQGVGAYRI
jgi:hypothetical protein